MRRLTLISSHSLGTEEPVGTMQLGGNMKPSRIRVLDLPFTAVEWVLPEEISPAQYLGQDKWIVWERSPLARERSLFGYWDDADDGQLPSAAHDGAAQGPDNEHPSTSGEATLQEEKKHLRASFLDLPHHQPLSLHKQLIRMKAIMHHCWCGTFEDCSMACAI